MKRFLNPSVLILIITGCIFVAGAFYLQVQLHDQITSTSDGLDNFITQVDSKKEELDSANEAFSSTIKSKQDLLNYYQHKTESAQTTEKEHVETDSSDTDSDSASTSVFNQN